MKLQNRVALVTGGSRSIGRAIALRLGSEGADVAVNYVANAIAATEVVQALRAMGRKALAIQADVSRADHVQRLVETVLDSFGRIDILVNNAGIVSRAPFLELTEEEWDRVMAVDLKGPFLVGQAVARHMAERRAGRIINIASISAHIAFPGLTHYQVAKAGVYMLTRGMALELAPYGVLVNAIAPGVVETDLNRERLADPAFRTMRLSKIPLGRFASPDDIAGAVVYLASDDSQFVTGSTITIDGGQTLH